LLQDVGLGYLQLGQPINTLSGGESQRLKLVRHLAEATSRTPNAETRYPKEARRPKSEHRSQELSRNPDFGNHSAFGIRDSDLKRTLFLLDEPTTGLHFDDVRVLLDALQRLVDAGHSLVVIEHNLDVLKCADWIIDLGPEASALGGQLVVAGTPEEVADCKASHTGRFLRGVFESSIG
jgi:excinuclease ABC subunit A